MQWFQYPPHNVSLQVLEEVGIKPRRYAGASAGAMVAALAAVGYNSAEIRGVLELDLEELLLGKFTGVNLAHKDLQ